MAWPIGLGHVTFYTLKHIYKTSNAVNFQFGAQVYVANFSNISACKKSYRRAGRLFETARLRQTNSSFNIIYLLYLHTVLCEIKTYSLTDRLSVQCSVLVYFPISAFSPCCFDNVPLGLSCFWTEPEVGRKGHGEKRRGAERRKKARISRRGVSRKLILDRDVTMLSTG